MSETQWAGCYKILMNSYIWFLHYMLLSLICKRVTLTVLIQDKMSETPWAGYTGQCNPEVWNENAKPPQPTEKKVGQLTDDQLDEYFREVSEW